MGYNFRKKTFIPKKDDDVKIYKSNFNGFIINNNIITISLSSAWNKFDKKHIEEAIIKNTITYIGKNGFKDCEKLKNVVLPDSVKILYGNSFENCHALTSITLPDAITEIKDYTFKNCYSLKKIVYKGIEYTDKTIFSALLENGVKVSPNAFMGTIFIDVLYEEGEGNEVVDLNLPSGNKWMKFNLGGNNIVDSGKYYQWGDTVGYTGDEALAHSTWETCLFEENTPTITELSEDYDPVYKMYGDGYCMPTQEDIDELIENTVSSNATINDVDGVFLTSKTNSGNTIFIPFGGFYYNNNFGEYNIKSGLWTKTLNQEFKATSYILYSDKDDALKTSLYRYYGLNIRGLLKNNNSGSKEEEKEESKEEETNYYESGNGNDTVDLGLSVNWMKFNLGTTNNTTYGKYYPWGDTVGYTGDEAAARSTWSTAPFNGGNSEFSDSAFDAVSGSVLTYSNGYYNLNPEYDAVTAKYGSGFRMPTAAEISELLTLANEWTTVNGVNGRLFHGKGTGKGNTLFIPASGFYSSDGLEFTGSHSSVWSSSIDSSYHGYAFYMDSQSNYIDMASGLRAVSFCLHGIFEKPNYKIEDNTLYVYNDNAWGTFNNTKITTCIISDSVTNIPKTAFNNYTNLKTVKIGSGVTSIEEYAFFICTSLSSITIPDSVTSIGNNAFFKCTSLTSITIPNLDFALNLSYLNNEFDPESMQYIVDNIQNGGSIMFSETSANYLKGHLIINTKAYWDGNTLKAGTDPNAIYYYGSAPEMVDLGLSVKWMKCNLGADNNYDDGLYYQWGDTVGYTGDEAKAHSTWDTAPFNGGNNDYSDSAFDAVSGSVLTYDGTYYNLKPEYDAVTVKYGSGYRMPTAAEISELTGLTNEWTTVNGVNGRLFHGKGSGEGNTLFIPASGCFYYGSLNDTGSYGYMWSSSINADGNYVAWNLYFDSDYCVRDSNIRHYGWSVRGVGK